MKVYQYLCPIDNLNFVVDDSEKIMSTIKSLEVGQSITIRVSEMSKKEFKELPEYA